MIPHLFGFQTLKQIFFQNPFRLLDIALILEYHNSVVHGGVAQLVRALA